MSRTAKSGTVLLVRLVVAHCVREGAHILDKMLGRPADVGSLHRVSIPSVRPRCWEGKEERKLERSSSSRWLGGKLWLSGTAMASGAEVGQDEQELMSSEAGRGC